MGVCDFVDFVQRNGQSIQELCLLEDNDSDYESTQCGTDKAILVLVPNTYSKREILSWTLSRFAKFKKICSSYSWDTTEFSEVSGYPNVLSENGEWWDHAIWKSDSPKFGKYHIVNFETNTFNILVLSSDSMANIPKSYLRVVFENRDLDMPPKKQAIEKIIDCGEENLWEYDKKQLTPLEVSIHYKELRKEILSLPVFKERFIYRVEMPSTISKARLTVLIQDYINMYADNVKAIPPGETANRFHLYEASGSVCLFTVMFYPLFNIDIESSILNGCLKCGKKRWIGKYTCFSHMSLDLEKLKTEAQDRIKSETKVLCENLENTRHIEMPHIITIDFDEKNVHHKLHLICKNPIRRKNAIDPSRYLCDAEAYIVLKFV